MDLEGLKALLDAAVAEAKAKPDDTELADKVVAAQAAYDKKKSEESITEEPSDEFDESKVDEKTKAYIAKLRKESASHRIKNKELSSKFTTSEEQKRAILKAAGLLDEEKPEEKLQKKELQNNVLEFRNAVLETALEHGIPKEQLKYYQFLVSDATAELGDGEELSDEKLKEIVAECKKKGGSGKANSSVQKLDKDGNPIKDPKPGESGKLTFEEFLAMGVVAKSKLYQESPAVYEEFYKMAKAKRKLV